ncbi:hypothetical protein PM082_021879 [Marasmius tenuissimus]|nr:hypothetical protein PM082_021879 [Marasmius tenuissimus]
MNVPLVIGLVVALVVVPLLGFLLCAYHRQRSIGSGLRSGPSRDFVRLRDSQDEDLEFGCKGEEEGLMQDALKQSHAKNDLQTAVNLPSLSYNEQTHERSKARLVQSSVSPPPNSYLPPPRPPPSIPLPPLPALKEEDTRHPFLHLPNPFADPPSAAASVTSFTVHSDEDSYRKTIMVTEGKAPEARKPQITDSIEEVPLMSNVRVPRVMYGPKELRGKGRSQNSC